MDGSGGGGGVGVDIGCGGSGGWGGNVLLVLDGEGGGVGMRVMVSGAWGWWLRKLGLCTCFMNLPEAPQLRHRGALSILLRSFSAWDPVLRTRIRWEAYKVELKP